MSARDMMENQQHAKTTPNLRTDDQLSGSRGEALEIVRQLRAREQKTRYNERWDRNVLDFVVLVEQLHITVDVIGHDSDLCHARAFDTGFIVFLV